MFLSWLPDRCQSTPVPWRASTRSARPRGAQAAFACYAGLAILLWLFRLAMGHQPGAVAAMHALLG
jgi:hypothetical protein